MLGEIITESILELIGSGVKRLGAWIRWMITGRSKPYQEILKEDWNRRVGWLAVVILSLLAYCLISKVFFPGYEIIKVVEESQSKT